MAFMFSITSVVFTVHFSNIDFVSQVSSHIFPNRLKVLAMSTPRSIKFDKPRFFTFDNIFQLLRSCQLDTLTLLVSLCDMPLNILVYTFQRKVASVFTPSTSVDVGLNGGCMGNTLLFTIVEVSSTVDSAKVSSRMSLDELFPFRFYRRVLAYALYKRDNLFNLLPNSSHFLQLEL